MLEILLEAIQPATHMNQRSIYATAIAKFGAIMGNCRGKRAIGVFNPNVEMQEQHTDVEGLLVFLIIPYLSESHCCYIIVHSGFVLHIHHVCTTFSSSIPPFVMSYIDRKNYF